MVRQLRSYSTSGSVKKHPKEAARAENSNIRLRSGSAGQRPTSIKDDDEDHEPIEFAAKSSVTDPKDIRIVETDPSGEAHEATHLTLGENETHFYNTEAEIEEEDDRGGWGNQLDFLFSCISVSVGLGNVWRFPYLCFKNGGGTFLIIYAISMFACGIPIFFQEVAAGQYLGAGGLTMVGQFVPILQGVGYATMTIVFFLDIYYCIIIAWTLFYLLATFISIPELPWGTCGNWWNSVNCFDGDHVANVSAPVKHNGSKTPVEEYWDRRVLQITTGMEDLGGVQWELLGCLILGWAIVYLIIWKGLHASGKIIWFTALFPYFVMSILFMRSITLDGAGLGIYHFFHIKWESFLNSETWIDSATQIFFAYSIGTGALPALGSYNKFHHNCVKDTVITCIVNTGTCVFAGIVTFSILGHMAHNQGVEIEKVVASGPGLVFITYPEVVMKLPGGPMWAITFFVMLVTIGIDSEFCLVESLVTGIVDMWPEYLRPRRRLFTSFVCLGLFILGIPMVTNGGAYVFQLMDFYSASGIPILWCCFFQTIAIGWIFGVEKFALCVEQMTGYKPNYYWILTWSIIAPLVMALVFISYFISWTPVKYGEVEYPMFAHIIGFGLSLASMLWIPGYALYYICMQRGNLRDRFVKGITPNIISKRSTAPPKSVVKEMQMSESSARLLKNASFLTKNSSFTAENP